uniref:Predicted gene 10135 n=1 Tax=Peromyscus maniculatus bairdii TaxID=230844 RepID=A0A8C8TV87_PERMB
AGTGFCTTGGPGEEVVCVNCVLSWLPEPEPWLLNAFTGCRRANGDGAAGERNLPGEGTLPLLVDEVGSNCLALREVRGKFFSL